MKKLAVSFKKRINHHESIPKLRADRKYGEDIEYNIDHETEKKIKHLTFFNNLKNTWSLSDGSDHNYNNLVVQNF